MTKTFNSRTKALEGWFDKPMAELPSPLRKHVVGGCFPWHWDSLDADQRRSAARRWDYENDPANKEEREQFFEEACEIHRIEQAIQDLERMAPSTPLEMESKDRQLDELRKQLKEIKPTIEKSAPRSSRTSNPVAKHKIVTAFVVQSHNNNGWWDGRMRDAKRYGLAECRASRGRGHRPSFWYPDYLAAWLVEKKHMKSKIVADILRKHFPDCAESADLLEHS